MESCFSSLDIISGPMFSGKTTSLLRLLFNDSTIGLKVIYVNSDYDNRSSNKAFSTHNPLYKTQLQDKSGVDFISTKSLSEVYNTLRKYDTIGLDE